MRNLMRNLMRNPSTNPMEHPTDAGTRPAVLYPSSAHPINNCSVTDHRPIDGTIGASIRNTGGQRRSRDPRYQRMQLFADGESSRPTPGGNSE